MVLVYLGGDVLVGEPHHEPVLGGVVFVFVLDDEPFAGVVVRPPLPPPLELHLEPLEVRLVLHHLHETLQTKNK